MQRARLAVAGATIASALAACGDDSAEPAERTLPPDTYNGQPQQRTYSDPAGDVRITAQAEEPPDADSLDLRELSARRSREGLRVTFVHAEEAQPPMRQRFEVIERKGVLDARIDVSHLPGRPATAFLRPADGPGEPLEVQERGRRVTVQAPLTELMRGRRFKLRATVLTRGEIVDRLPDAASTFEFFPSRGR